MRAALPALVLVTAVSLAGCKTANELLEGPKLDYKSAGSLPPLEIPPDLTAPSRDNRYVVPETGRGSATLSGYQADRGRQPRVGESGVLPNVDKMRIERSGSQRWLVINEPADKMWPLVKEFWQENGFLVSIDQPEAGVMETDWAENRAKLPQDFIRSMLGKLVDQVYSTPERDKFRTRLERGTDPNVTEIYVSHRGMIEIYVSEARSQTMWQPRNPDPELEAEFLRRLMIRLGTQEEKAKQMMAGTPQQLRAAMAKGGDGKELLDVYEPFDRAWRRVGLALDRVGFTVEDRDRQKGVYFVRYADSDATKPKDSKPGILDRFAFWRSGDPKIKAEQYRVQVKQGTKPGAESSEIMVLNKDGADEQSQTTKRILTLLHEQLR
jgi:outer membrane protein assembly factor BamC